jgi:hypothetical protein
MASSSSLILRPASLDVRHVLWTAHAIGTLLPSLLGCLPDSKSHAQANLTRNLLHNYGTILIETKGMVINMKTNNSTPHPSLTDRYVYAVTRRLPVKQRADIDMEVRGLVDDMLGDRFPGRESEDDSVRAVLAELGNPAVLADQYREKKTFLIGPDYFDIYFMVLKIVLASILGGLMIALTIKNIVTPPDSLLNFGGELISAIMGGLFQGFAWVTIIFALIERYAEPSLRSEISGITAKKGCWKPDDLPVIPQQNAIIKRGESIVGIIFGVLFLVLINTAPQIFGILFTNDGNVQTIPVLNLENFRSFLPLLNLILCLGLVKEGLRLFEGKYTIRLSIATTVLGAFSLVLAISLIRDPNFWNPDFLTDLSSYMKIDDPSSLDIARILKTIFRWVIALAVFGYITDVATSFYKAIRYRS